MQDKFPDGLQRTDMNLQFAGVSFVEGPGTYSLWPENRTIYEHL